MKIKLSEANQRQLDWLVAELEFQRLMAQGSRVKPWVLDEHRAGLRTDPYTTDWMLAGPIIDAQDITVTTIHNGKERWGAYLDDRREFVESLCSGPTPQIAAMRCFVASVLGHEVEVPEALA